MQQGYEIGALARTVHPDGILVSRTDEETTVEITRRYIADDTKETIFEARSSLLFAVFGSCEIGRTR
jgi:hypothetical protein